MWGLSCKHLSPAHICSRWIEINQSQDGEQRLLLVMQKTHWEKKRRVKTYTLGCGKLFYSIPFFGCFGESNLLINTYVFHTLDCHGNLVNFQHQYFAVLKIFKMLYSSNKPVKKKSMLINSKRYKNFAVRDCFKEQVCVIESNLLALSHCVRKAHKETFNLLMYGFFHATHHRVNRTTNDYHIEINHCLWRNSWNIEKFYTRKPV